MVFWQRVYELLPELAELLGSCYRRRITGWRIGRTKARPYRRFWVSLLRRGFVPSMPLRTEPLALLPSQAPHYREVVQLQTVHSDGRSQLDVHRLIDSSKQIPIAPQLLRCMPVDIQSQHLCQQLPLDSIRNVPPHHDPAPLTQQLEQVLDVLPHHPQRKIDSPSHHLTVRRQHRQILIQHRALGRLPRILRILQPKRQLERRRRSHIRPHVPLWQIPLSRLEHVHHLPIPNHDPNMKGHDRQRPLPG